MTKYILQSGGVKNYPVKAKKFLEEVVKNIEGNPKILMCLFAQPREVWEEKFVAYTESYKNLCPQGVIPEFTLAFPESFEQQIYDCDVVMIQGGDDHLVQYWLGQFDIPNIWRNKTIVGNSGSSDALVKSFWTCDWRKTMNGLGIIPVKFIPHFKSELYGLNDPRGPIDWEAAYEELKQFGDDLPIHALEEGDYIVIEQ